MDIEKLKAKLQAKKEEQKRMTEARKQADAAAVQKLMADVEKSTRKTFDDAAKKLFGQYWKQ